MINLRTLFKNHFDTREISDDNLKLGAQKHLERMKASNPGGIYDPLIAATTAAYDNYYVAITDESFTEAQREASTVSVDKLFSDFKTLVSQKEGIVRGTWGKDSPEYQEFYPHGITEYTNAVRANADALMDRYLDALNSHAADLPPAMIADFTTLAGQYKAARTAQLARMGDLSADKYSTSALRDALEIQLMKNVLTIALNNIGNPDVADVYFDQSMFRTSPGNGAGELYTSDIATKVKAIVVEGGFDGSSIFHIANTGDAVLQFYTTANPESAVPENAVRVQPGDSTDVAASSLGDSENAYLMVYNEDAVLTGSYEVSISEG